jgi:esterase/lipase
MKPQSIFYKSVVFLLLFFTFTYSQLLYPEDITVDRDGVQLKGKFYIAEGKEIFPSAILLQGFPGGEMDVLGVGEKLSEVGINALTFNYSGIHQSEGEFNFDNSQKDIEAVFEFIHQSENIQKYKIDTTRIILGGYSYGGGMALTYAANHPEIEEVFSIAGNDHGAFMKEYNRNPEMQKEIDQMFDELKAETEIVRFGPGGTVKEIAEMNIIELNPTYDLRYCSPLLVQKRILLIAGWDDHGVSIENIVLPLYRELKKDKAENIKIIAFQDNHSFKNSRDELARMIIEWIKEKSTLKK